MLQFEFISVVISYYFIITKSSCKRTIRNLTMDTVYISDPSGLKDEEMEYEFCLRATPVRGGVQERQRSLGVLLRQPEDPDRVQFTAYSLAEDLINIPRQLKEIERSLEAGLGDDGYSRLVHYHKRLRRYVPETDELFQQRKILLDGIERLSRKYYQIDLAHVGRQVPLSRVNTLQSNWAPVNPVQSGQDLVDMTVDSGEGAVGGILEDRPARAANAPPVNTAMVQETLQPRYTGTKPKASRDLLAAPVPAPRQGGQSSYNQWLYGFSPADAGPNESIRPLGSNAPGWRQPATTDRNNSTLTLPEDQPRRTQPQSNYVRGLFGHTSGSVPPPTHQPQSQVNMGRSAATSSPTPTLRNEPIEETDLNEYIHVSDVKDYLRACLEQLMKQELNGEPVPTEAVDNIAEQVANVNLRNDSEMLQISQGLGRGPANHVPDSFRRTFPKQPGPQVLGAEKGWEDQSEFRPEPLNRGQDFQFRAARADTRPPEVDHSHNHQEERRVGWTPFGTGQSIWNRYEPRSAASLPIRARDNSRSAPRPSANDQVHSRRNHHSAWANDQPEYPRCLPHQQCNIIEKWPKFSGDSNPIPVSDYLRQIYMLSESYAISKQDLRMHAHILFKDSAYTWYTTYHDRFDCWNTLEHYLRLRYDNPNQDSIIKFELHNRKQRPNEKFSAFLTDLEFLAQRLTYRVPEKEIFELAKANMKLSYQRRLVLVTIESLDHLSNLCSRMDALEASLNKSTVHQIDLEEGCLEDEHDPELVYALQGRQGKCVRSKKENQPGSAEQRMESVMCWNCRGTGHMWRECDKRKAVFCHICGYDGTTAARCPSRHQLRAAEEDEDQKNE